MNQKRREEYLWMVTGAAAEWILQRWPDAKNRGDIDDVRTEMWLSVCHPVAIKKKHEKKEMPLEMPVFSGVLKLMIWRYVDLQRKEARRRCSMYDPEYHDPSLPDNNTHDGVLGQIIRLEDQTLEARILEIVNELIHKSDPKQKEDLHAFLEHTLGASKTKLRQGSTGQELSAYEVSNRITRGRFLIRRELFRSSSGT